MEISMQQTIDEGLRKIRDVRLTDDLHHGENMYIAGYAAALMHARVICPIEWGEICNQREAAHQYWKQHRNI